MNITAYFSEDGIAKTGLTPTITIVKVSDNSVVINAQLMTELTSASGWYKYNFSTIDSGTDYIFTADAGTGSVDDRYPTSAGKQDESVWETSIESTYTAQDILKVIASVLGGKVSVSGSNFTFRSIDDTSDRVTATTTETGDRTSVTINVS